MRDKARQRKGTIALFTIYLLALVWIIVFKFQLSVSTLPKHRAINLIPFSGGGFGSDGVYNLLVFMPYGIYVCLLWRGWPLAWKIAPIFLTSLLFEVVQYAFGIGASDINDLLLNTLGGGVGVGLYALLARLLGDRTDRVLRMAALVATALAIAFIAAMSLLVTYRF